MIASRHIPVDRSASKDRPAALDFLGHATALTTTDELDRAFAAAIEEAGFAGYECRACTVDRSHPPRAYSIEDEDRPSCCKVVVVVENWCGGWTLMTLTGHAGEIDPSARARAAQLATLFIARREQISA